MSDNLSLDDGTSSSWSFTDPLVSTKHIPLGTRLFILSIMLVIIAFTTYLFYYRTDNVSVSFAKNYDPNMFYSTNSAAAQASSTT